MNNKGENKLKTYIYIAIIIILLISILAVAYALFNYTRVSDDNTVSTGNISFDYIDGASMTIENQSPIGETEATTGNDHKISFQIKAHNTISSGMRYNVYAIYGDNEQGKTRLLDSVVSLKFVPSADANGFTTTINNHETAKSLNFVDGKALISTGIIKNTTEEVTKNYDAYLWIDEEKVFVSSSTKREVLPEGNPSLAVSTLGKVTANRYVKNDNTTLQEVSLFPASENAQNKIIYTTNEYKNAYYSIKIVVEAIDIRENDEVVYFDTNGGTINTLTKKVKVGETYGTLPVPTREGYTFLGWNGKNMLSSFEIGKMFGLSNGIMSNGSASATTDFIPVDFEKNESYILTVSDEYRTMVGAYNENYEYLGRISGAKRSSLVLTGDMFQVNVTEASGPVKYVRVRVYENEELSGEIENANNYQMQLEVGNTATTYEPYLVTNSVTVTQSKDHVLKAIWQKNN